MKLRRPVLEDKEEILAMYKEFQKKVVQWMVVFMNQLCILKTG